MLNSFATVGSNHELLSESEQVEGFIRMKSIRPAPHYVAAESGDWVDAPQEALSCSRLQGELALLDEPSPDAAYPTMLHWVEGQVEAELDPVRKRTLQAYLNATTWRSDDPLVPTMWQAAGRDLDELPALFTKAQGL